MPRPALTLRRDCTADDVCASRALDHPRSSRTVGASTRKKRSAYQSAQRPCSLQRRTAVVTPVCKRARVFGLEDGEKTDQRVPPRRRCSRWRGEWSRQSEQVGWKNHASPAASKIQQGYHLRKSEQNSNWFKFPDPPVQSCFPRTLSYSGPLLSIGVSASAFALRLPWRFTRRL